MAPALGWPMLHSLLPADQDRIARAAVRKRYDRGQTVFREQDPSDSVHLVVRGHFAVQVSTAQGEVSWLNVMSPGETFGELSLVPDGTRPVRSASVVALDEAETLSLTVRDLDALGTLHPGIYRWVAALLGQRVRELSGRVRDLMFEPLEVRLVSTLRLLGRIYADPLAPDAPFTVPLTQESLAGFVGGTRPSVNQALRQLAAQGIVEIGRGRVTVLTPSALRDS